MEDEAKKILLNNYIECLKQYDRYALISLGSAVSFLVLMLSTPLSSEVEPFVRIPGISRLSVLVFRVKFLIKNDN
jgi:hypothetical protein